MGWTEYVEVLSNFIMGMRADVHVILNLVRDWRGCKYDAIRAAPLLQHVLLIVVTCLLLTCLCDARGVVAAKGSTSHVYSSGRWAQINTKLLGLHKVNNTTPTLATNAVKANVNKIK